MIMIRNEDGTFSVEVHFPDGPQMVRVTSVTADADPFSSGYFQTPRKWRPTWDEMLPGWRVEETMDGRYIAIRNGR